MTIQDAAIAIIVSFSLEAGAFLTAALLLWLVQRLRTSGLYWETPSGHQRIGDIPLGEERYHQLTTIILGVVLTLVLQLGALIAGLTAFLSLK